MFYFSTAYSRFCLAGLIDVVVIALAVVAVDNGPVSRADDGAAVSISIRKNMMVKAFESLFRSFALKFLDCNLNFLASRNGDRFAWLR